MIISASRRTDVPGFFSEWLGCRLGEGYALVRNPFNARQVSRVSLDPAVIDGIVLWTKNPIPMLPRIAMLDSHSWYMQYTLNPYGNGIERRLPELAERVAAFWTLGEAFGPERVVWRYDPVFFSELHTVSWHVRWFSKLAEALAGRCDTVSTSFMHMYAKTRRNTASLALRSGDPHEQVELLGRWNEISAQNGMTLRLCATPELLEATGVLPATCMDAGRMSRISGVPLRSAKDPGQRPDCNCAPSVDIGAYDTCGHGCAYCYANGTDRRALAGLAAHDPASPLLAGCLTEHDVVTERVMPSLAAGPDQLNLLD